jgi:asparagine synthase (glutamine-hydrolysing)
MCGICGWVRCDGEPVDPRVLDAMTAVLRHRGPDGCGVLTLPPPGDGNSPPAAVGLGHVRLAVIDLSPEAGQPMTNEDGSLILTYNGEIYNYRELRAELAAKGHRFRSASDTEVILHLYEECGVEAVARLNGMFAFALWDAPRRRLWLCRDRMGVKPLVYCHAGGSLRFASEIKSLLADPGLPRELDPEALRLYLAFNYVPAPRTMLRGIRKLEPGCSLIWEEGRAAVRRYYRPLPPPEAQPEPPDRLRRRLVQALEEAVAGCMIADVPIGAFLSGGVDSGIVLALMARQSARPIKTFSIGFPESGRHDETAAARRIAAWFRTDHHELRVRPADVLDAVPEVLACFDEPFADSSAVAAHLVARETRRHVTVALSGDGGDELFGGYRAYLAEHWRGRYWKIPALLRTEVIEPLVARLPDSRESRLGEAVRRAKKFLRASRGEPAARLLALKEIAPGARRAALLVDGGDAPAEDPGLAWVRGLLARSTGDPINRLLYTDIIDSLSGDMLAKVDLTSMRHALEVRVPLLDPRVVEVALEIPGPLKIRRGVTKHFLKEAFKDVLPPGHTRLPKSGFEVPLSLWLRRELRPLAARCLGEDRIRAQGIFHYPAVRSLVADHDRRRADTSWMIWNLIVFQEWHARVLGA